MHLTVRLGVVGWKHLDVLDQDPTYDTVEEDEAADDGQRDPRGRRARDRGQTENEYADADGEREIAVRKKVDCEGVRALGVSHLVIDRRWPPGGIEA